MRDATSGINVANHKQFLTFSFFPGCRLTGAGSHTNNATKATTCTPCNTGEYAPSPLTVVCSQCPVGRSSTSGQASCAACEGGRYSDVEGSSTCAACEEQGATSLEGAAGCLVCKEGYFRRDGLFCEECGNGANKGIACPDEGTTLQTVTVEEGWWRSSSSSGEFRQCPQAELCVGGTDGEDICEVGHTGPYW